MPGMGRGFGITAAVPHDVAATLAAEVERLGYTSFWVNDMADAEGLESLAAVSGATSHITIGVGVIPLDTRPPDVIAQRLRALALPLERLVLGVGSGNSKRALALVRTGVAALQAEVDAKVVVGALGPKMSALAGEVADGVLFNWMTPEHIAHLAPTVQGSLMAYVRCALLPGAEARLSAELDRYSGLPQYEQHLARMNATALDTCVVGTDGAALRPGLARFEAVLDETIVRAITADDALDTLVALAHAAAPR